MKFLRKNEYNIVQIGITKETYAKLVMLRDIENKDFSTIIEESLKGKEIIL